MFSIMEPYYQEFYTLRSMINDISLGVVYDHFDFEDDYTDSHLTNAVSDMLERGEVPMTERYDIKINEIYHRNFLDNLETAFNHFNWEIKKNIKTKLLNDMLPQYIKVLKKELIAWNDRIIIHEAEINSSKKWFYINKDVDLNFLKSKGISNSIIDNISNIFLYQKNNIIEILESIEEAEKTDFGKNETQISDELFAQLKTPREATGVLDIYQSALLFHYLRKYRGIMLHTEKSLARIVSALTGHSEQNIRTDKGFGSIANIIADKTKNKNFKEIPNYNLVIVKDFLQNIIDELDREIEENT